MRYLTSAIALVITILPAQAAMAEKDNFRVYNDTGATLERLYITESGYGGWGQDILRQSVLPDGYSVGIDFVNPSPRVCYYDIRAVFSTNEVTEKYGVNVCINDLYTIYRRPSRPAVYY